MAQQIRSAQQKAALAGQAPPAWAIGAKCHALSPLDGDWAEAVVKGISASGNFVVAFTGRDSELEEVCHHAKLSNCLNYVEGTNQEWQQTNAEMYDLVWLPRLRNRE